MVKGFPSVLSSQTLSATADNALLIVAIAVLGTAHDPAWMTPLLKLCFVVSYIIFAAYVGVVADAFPKGRVMLYSNGIKIVGCLMMFCSIHPLFAYAVVGLGAAFYSPAKYGILSELLPPKELIKANSWMEGLTVVAVIVGTVLGGFFVSPLCEKFFVNTGWSFFGNGAKDAVLATMLLYVFSGILNLLIPNTDAKYPNQNMRPGPVFKDFIQSCKILFNDRKASTSLAGTSTFWGTVSSLQLLLLAWGGVALNLNLSQSSYLLATVIFGVVLGAIFASCYVSLQNSLKVLPLGLVMGAFVATLSSFHSSLLPGWTEFLGIDIRYAVAVASVLLIILGAIAGVFLVPMDALLQYRGSVLLSAGKSVGVQNLCENSSILLMMFLYSILSKAGFGPVFIMIMFGIFLAFNTCLIMLHSRRRNEESAVKTEVKAN